MQPNSECNGYASAPNAMHIHNQVTKRIQRIQYEGLTHGVSERVLVVFRIGWKIHRLPTATPRSADTQQTRARTPEYRTDRTDRTDRTLCSTPPPLPPWWVSPVYAHRPGKDQDSAGAWPDRSWQWHIPMAVAPRPAWAPPVSPAAAPQANG